MARLLVIMGSGETSPTMSKVHRELLARAGPGPAVMLDTPFGFQENADDISAKAMAYFKESVQREITVASFRAAEGVDPVAYATMLARLREASYVFAGPGSPSYAVAQWSASQVPAVLAQKLRTGGCVTFASAAACTLGPYALPVYEIYKAGDRVRWLDGLNLTGEIGLPAVIVPHFNNAEGGNHDTRYCYMGERRLSVLEAMLPPDVFILGVDEHTACILDIDAGTATVAGLGSVTVRREGQMSAIVTGTTVPIAELAAAAPGELRADAPPPDAVVDVGRSVDPLVADIDRYEHAFDSALASGDAAGAVKVVLELDDLLHDWSHDTTQSDLLDRGRAGLRAMIVRLGEAADVGVRDPRVVVGPFVEALLDARRQARADGRWADADTLRDRVVAAGVEVRDTAGGTEWQLR
ncbi:MAG: CysS/YqeB C-terminal domain-containing protein [Acidimicrobiales bacterium]